MSLPPKVSLAARCIANATRGMNLSAAELLCAYGVALSATVKVLALPGQEEMALETIIAQLREGLRVPLPRKLASFIAATHSQLEDVFADVNETAPEPERTAPNPRSPWRL